MHKDGWVSISVVTSLACFTIKCIIQRIRKVYEKIMSEVKQHLAEYKVGWLTVPVVTSLAQLLFNALSKENGKFFRKMQKVKQNWA